MKPEEAFELRRTRWEKFKDHFVPAAIQGVINTELLKYNLTFPVDPDDWLLVCWVPIFYYSFGFEQKDEAEVPAYIEATSRFHRGTKPIGPRVTVKLIPPKSVDGDYEFPGLKQLVDEVLSGKEVQASPKVFTVASILEDPTAPPTKDETASMVERMVDALVEMGYSRRGAAKRAHETIDANPGIDSIDRLLEAVIEGE